MLEKQKINLKQITFLLFSIFFFVGFFTFKDYGISVDEEYGRFAGFYWLSYILSFLPFDELKNLVDLKLNKLSLKRTRVQKNLPANDRRTLGI